MSVRQRILSIRLIEKLSAFPQYAEALGLEISKLQVSEKQEDKEK